MFTARRYRGQPRKLRFPTAAAPVEQKLLRARDLYGLTLDRPSKVVIRSRVFWLGY